MIQKAIGELFLVQMLISLFPFFGQALIKNITEQGYNAITITRTDLVFIDLLGKVAIFTDTASAGLSIGYRGNRNAYTDYFPVSVPEFTASGISVTVRTSLRQV
jgi:hypothetical protein